MANCKSIRLDFPASEVDGLTDEQVLGVLQDAVAYYATHSKDRARILVAIALSKAVSSADVNNYDDHGGSCGPVFYIP